MNTWGIVFIALGAFYLLGLGLKLPLFFTNPKSKFMIKKMGERNFKIFVLVWGCLCIALGLYLI